MKNICSFWQHCSRRDYWTVRFVRDVFHIFGLRAVFCAFFFNTLVAHNMNGRLCLHSGRLGQRYVLPTDGKPVLFFLFCRKLHDGLHLLGIWMGFFFFGKRLSGLNVCCMYTVFFFFVILITFYSTCKMLGEYSPCTRGVRHCCKDGLEFNRWRC